MHESPVTADAAITENVPAAGSAPAEAFCPPRTDTPDAGRGAAGNTVTGRLARLAGPAPSPADLAAARAGIAAGALCALATLAPVVLYQVGIVGHLPDPPLPGFDADKVHASPEAYPIGSIPDGAIGMASYGVTLALAVASTRARADRIPWLRPALAAKVCFDLSQAARLTWVEIAKLQAISGWSVLTSAATVASVYPALLQARAALHRSGRS